ncbi:MAG: hypothetical protein ACQEQE_08745 [Bacillota bacterium]
MKIKKIIIFFVFIFLIITSFTFSASDFIDIYDAYNVEKGYDDLVSLIEKDPPEVIRLEPVEVQWGKINMPLNNKELLVIKRNGKDSFNFNVSGSHNDLEVSISSEITFNYDYDRDNKYSVLFFLDHSTHLVSNYNDINEPNAYKDERSTKRAFVGGYGGYENNELTLQLALPRQNENGNLGRVKFRFHSVKMSGNPFAINIDTNASKDIGETDVTIPKAIMIGLISGIAGLAGASIASNNQNSELERKRSSSYKMVIYKEFGNKIKINNSPVYIYARIVEVTKDGKEIQRNDLTEEIEIFSKQSFFEIGTTKMSGDYLGASVEVNTEKKNILEEGIISFRYLGKGGSFQNNVKFEIIGEEYISLKDSNLYVLATSKSSFKMPYELKDFLNEAKVNVNTMQKKVPFELKLKEDEKGNKYIKASDLAVEKPIEKFFDSFTCEIIAENDNEYARTVFNVVMCYEGILPDFLGKSKEIKGFKNEKDEMEKTKIAFKLGLWDEENKKLEFHKPQDLKISLEDEKDIFEVIGMDYEVDDEREIKDAILYNFKAKISFPSLESIDGLLKISCSQNGKDFSSETEIELLPDKLKYKENYEKAYEECLYIINTYLPERFRERKIKELEKYKNNFGIKDLEIFKKQVWEISQRAILQEKEKYLIESYWYDEAIATAELVVAIGDIAFDIAISSVGGPLAGFTAAQAKATFIDIISLYIEKPSIGMDEIMMFLEKRFVQMVGQSDGAFNTPKPNEYKKLVAWLSCYIVYRICYHKYYDKDKNNNPIGYVEAVKRGIYDMSGKSLSIFISDYVQRSNFKSSVTLQASEKMSKKYEKTQDVIIDFIDRIQKGGIEFN